MVKLLLTDTDIQMRNSCHTGWPGNKIFENLEACVAKFIHI